MKCHVDVFGWQNLGHVPASRLQEGLLTCVFDFCLGEAGIMRWEMVWEEKFSKQKGYLKVPSS